MHDKRDDTKSFYFEESMDAFSAASGVGLHDTQEIHSYLQSDGQPRLAYATEVILGRVIQGGGGGDHSPVEDAKATMELYLLKHPYDHVAEGEKLKLKAQKTRSKRRACGVEQPTTQQESTLADFIKVKTPQGKAKRAKASAATVGK